MQDTILQMTRKSVQRYVDSVIWFLPMSTAIRSSHDVTNVYWKEEEIAAMGAAKDKFPLFQVDLVLTEENEVVYSHEPDDVVHTILKTFDSGLTALQEITQLEQKLMPHLFKSNQKMHLKVPFKPESLPEKPDPANKKLLPDENTWVYEEYDRLRRRISETVEPLTEYIATFKAFQEEYKLDPDKLIAELDDPENPPDAAAVTQLQKDVNFHRQEAERLKELIPETKVVSMFLVNCRKVRDIVAEKHTKIADQMIEIIAKAAKKMANDTMEGFDQVNLRVESQPKDIEELSSIKDYMAGVPNEIQKLKNDIATGMKIYGILEGFQYKFADEEDYDRQWRLYGSPMETLGRIAKQGNFLDKEKDKFVNIMQQDQVEFDTKVAEIGALVAKFDENVDMAAYEEVAKNARVLKQKLDDAQA